MALVAGVNPYPLCSSVQNLRPDGDKVDHMSNNLDVSPARGVKRSATPQTNRLYRTSFLNSGESDYGHTHPG